MSDEIGKRADACKGWRWMPGMVAGCGGRRVRAKRTQYPPYRGALPDLTDPATLGCLLALVESLHGVAWLVPCPTIGWFCFYGKMGTPDKESTYAMSRAEALVAALEAAEGREVKDD